MPAALAFLTRIPVGRWFDFDGEDVARSGFAFPLVGAAIGATVGGAAVLFDEPLPPSLAVALALAVQVLLTGGMHVDALADTADALGGRSREHALEIMRDHAIGSYGAVAIALSLLIKATALAALVEHDRLIPVMVAAGALSRAAPVVLAAWLPYARVGSGTGSSLTRGGRGRAALAAGLALAITCLVSAADAAILAPCAAIFLLLLGVGFRRWLGGVTGDTLGAAIEVVELAVLVGAVALIDAG